MHKLNRILKEYRGSNILSHITSDKHLITVLNISIKYKIVTDGQKWLTPLVMDKWKNKISMSCSVNQGNETVSNEYIQNLYHFIR